MDIKESFPNIYTAHNRRRLGSFAGTIKHRFIFSITKKQTENTHTTYLTDKHETIPQNAEFTFELKLPFTHIHTKKLITPRGYL